MNHLAVSNAEIKLLSERLLLNIEQEEKIALNEDVLHVDPRKKSSSRQQFWLCVVAQPTY
jgi:hypothetical protein